MMKITIAIGIQKDIPMKVVQSRNSPLSDYKEFRAYLSDDNEYLKKLDEHLEKYIISRFSYLIEVF